MGKLNISIALMHSKYSGSYSVQISPNGQFKLNSAGEQLPLRALMKIAVNTRLLLKDNLEGIGYFVYETFRRITSQHQDHDFIFIFDRPVDPYFVFGKNVKTIVAGPPARHPLLWKYWFDYKIPGILRKEKADLFISCDGFCSLRTRTPQLLMVHDLAFLHHPAFAKRSHYRYYKRYTPKFLQKASRIATVSEFSKSDIHNSYNTAMDKMDVVYSAAKESFRPLSFDQRQEVKNKYTNGKEFFLYTGAIHPRKNLINLLKAFSIFKKRLHSNIKLVLAGRLAWNYDSFLEDLKRYKYRDDVILTGYVQESDLLGITASAYAMVYPSLVEGFGVPVLEAMQSGIPVITSSSSAMQEIAQKAALYSDPNDVNDIAEKMMFVYKDENLRNELIQKGEQQARNYSWQKTSELLWETILRTGKK